MKCEIFHYFLKLSSITNISLTFLVSLLVISYFLVSFIF